MSNELNIITQKMNALKQELDDIAKNKFGCDQHGGFPSKDLFNAYINENRTKLEHLNNLQKQVEELEWELKSPEEQAQILEQRRLSRLKREGKLFDEMD